MNEIAITKPYVLRHTQKGGRQVWGMGRGRGAEGREGEGRTWGDLQRSNTPCAGRASQDDDQHHSFIVGLAASPMSA